MQTITFNPENWKDNKLTAKIYKDGTFSLYSEKFWIQSDGESFTVYGSQWEHSLVTGFKIDDNEFYCHAMGVSRTGKTPMLAALKVLSNII